MKKPQNGWDFGSPDEAVGKSVNYWDKIYTIVGVVKDYCQRSPKDAFEPQIFRFMPHGRDIRGFFMMKLLPGSEKEILNTIGQKYNNFFRIILLIIFFLRIIISSNIKMKNFLVLFSGLLHFFQ